MPPPPTFDYYEALEIDRIATTEEIKSSYRRLARVYHPDKNLDDTGAATAAFQKIQIAHEILSDERARALYDARSSRPANGRSPFFSSSSSSSSGYGYEEYEEYEDCQPEDFDLFDYLRTHFARRPGGGFPGGFGGGSFFYDGYGFYRRAEMSPEEARKRKEEKESADAARRKRRADEFRRRKEAEEAQAKAREMAEAAEEAERVLAKERTELMERVRMERIWFAEKANTQEEKQELCLHTKFWAKEKSQKKFKCTTCGQKRGMVGHRCPHCDLLVCQVCLNKFNERRMAP